MYIRKLLNEVGIEVLCYGTDGDNRYLKAQKEIINFGRVTIHHGFQLASDFSAVDNFGNQDPEHIKKKMKNQLFDTSDDFIIGNRIATVGHLAILQKSFPKIEHGLTPSDLNPMDRMNYKCIAKIIDDKVLKLLPQVRNAQGTLTYLRIIKSLSIAFCEQNVTNEDRLKNAIFAVTFLRIWKKWLIDEKISMKHFVTSNVFEGIEVNMVLFFNLLKRNLLHLIPFLSSQNCERFFATLRTYTGMESLISNCSIKGFTSRANRIQLEEILMSKFCDKLKFPKLEARAHKQVKEPTILTNTEIETIISKAKIQAKLEALSLGMRCEINLKDITKEVKILENTEPVVQEEEIEEEEEDFLLSNEDQIDLNLMENEEENDEEIVKIITVDEIELTNDLSCKFT